ncbi:MAG: MFS transporter [Stackebrandtia sp.]
MGRTSLAVLRQRDFALLWWAGLISIAGNWMLIIAVPVAVYQLTGSAAVLAATTAAGWGPRILVGPLAGVFVDRWDRKRVLVIANLGQAVALAPLLLVDQPGEVWIVVAVLAVASSLSCFTSSAENALLPRLVPEAKLAAANSLNSANNNLARFAGPLLGGAALAAFGLSGVTLIDAASYLFAAVMITVGNRHRGRDRGTRRPRPHPHHRRLHRDRRRNSGTASVESRDGGHETARQRPGVRNGGVANQPGCAARILLA